MVLGLLKTDAWSWVTFFQLQSHEKISTTTWPRYRYSQQQSSEIKFNFYLTKISLFSATKFWNQVLLLLDQDIPIFSYKVLKSSSTSTWPRYPYFQRQSSEIKYNCYLTKISLFSATKFWIQVQLILDQDIPIGYFQQQSSEIKFYCYLTKISLFSATKFWNQV